MDKKWLGVALICVLLAISSVECIVGGHTTLPDEAPYMVSVQNPTHICGGVVVGEKAVLTTASCVQSRTNLRVLVGSQRLLTNQERIQVASIMIHDGYNSTSGKSNIAVLKLSASVPISARAAELNDAVVTTGSITAFYGWGSLISGSSARSNLLQTLYQKTLSTADCTTKYATNIPLSIDHICAHVQPGQAACSKDEGGPLVAYGSNKLLGIYDYGVQCSGKFPDAFVDIATFKQWIISSIAS